MDEPPKPYEEDGIPAGADWKQWIREKLADADRVLAFFSPRSVRKRGYVQREYKMALDLVNELPPGDVRLIPVLLEPCEVPDLQVGYVRLKDLQVLSLRERGIEGLISALAGPVRSVEARPGQAETVLMTTEEYPDLLNRFSDHSVAGRESAARIRQLIHDLISRSAVWIQQANREMGFKRHPGRIIQTAGLALAKFAKDLQVQNQALSEQILLMRDSYDRAVMAATDLDETDAAEIDRMERDILSFRESLDSLRATAADQSARMLAWKASGREFKRGKRLAGHALKELAVNLERQIEFIDSEREVIEAAHELLKEESLSAAAVSGASPIPKTEGASASDNAEQVEFVNEVRRAIVEELGCLQEYRRTGAPKSRSAAESAVVGTSLLFDRKSHILPEEVKAVLEDCLRALTEAWATLETSHDRPNFDSGGRRAQGDLRRLLYEKGAKRIELAEEMIAGLDDVLAELGFKA